MQGSRLYKSENVQSRRRFSRWISACRCLCRVGTNVPPGKKAPTSLVFFSLAISFIVNVSQSFLSHPYISQYILESPISWHVLHSTFSEISSLLHFFPFPLLEVFSLAEHSHLTLASLRFDQSHCRVTLAGQWQSRRTARPIWSDQCHGASLAEEPTCRAFTRT